MVIKLRGGVTIFVEGLTDTMRKPTTPHPPLRTRWLIAWSAKMATPRGNSHRQYSVHDEQIHSPLRFVSKSDLLSGRVTVATGIRKRADLQSTRFSTRINFVYLESPQNTLNVL